ncbi:hypothetical protein O3P69_014796 [Scylla paramamosain]|uniref:Uncharacterized protein n=1 Tax=Scylla paramamosain TaxID=85552 RepID=A0AAW0U121_SCYPA
MPISIDQRRFGTSGVSRAFLVNKTFGGTKKQAGVPLYFLACASFLVREYLQCEDVVPWPSQHPLHSKQEE